MDNTTNTPNQDDLNAIIKEEPLSDSTPIVDKQQEELKYKQILDEYSKQLASDESQTPQTSSQPVTDTAIPESIIKSNTEASAPAPQPILTPEPSLAPEPTTLPPIIQQTPPETVTTSDLPTSKTPPSFNIFKYLFYFSTIILIVISALLIKDYLKLQQLKKNPTKSTTPTITPLPTTTLSAENQTGCTINDKQYAIGESFKAEDGCNSCGCEQTDNGPQIVCTLMECSPNTSTSVEETTK